MVSGGTLDPENAEIFVPRNKVSPLIWLLNRTAGHAHHRNLRGPSWRRNLEVILSPQSAGTSFVQTLPTRSSKLGSSFSGLFTVETQGFLLATDYAETERLLLEYQQAAY